MMMKSGAGRVKTRLITHCTDVLTSGEVPQLHHESHHHEVTSQIRGEFLSCIISTYLDLSSGHEMMETILQVKML